MDEYTVDFRGVKTYTEFHQALKDGLQLPDYYGMNMDALWDCLWGFVDIKAVIHIRGLHSLPNSLKEEVEIMMRQFQDVAERYAKRGKEFIVEVID